MSFDGFKEAGLEPKNIALEVWWGRRAFEIKCPEFGQCTVKIDPASR